MALKASLLMILLLASAAAGAGSNGLRLEVEVALGNEFDDLAQVLPGAVECIVAKQPERCGIKEFGLEHLTENRIRTLFSGDVVTVSLSGRAGAGREIRAEFSPTSGPEVGVIYFRRIKGVLSPVAASIAIP